MIQRYTIIHEREPVATEHGEHCLFVDHAAELERVKGLISIRDDTEKDLRKQLADERAELAALHKVREAERAECDAWRAWWYPFGPEKKPQLDAAYYAVHDRYPAVVNTQRATDKAREKYDAKGGCVMEDYSKGVVFDTTYGGWQVRRDVDGKALFLDVNGTWLAGDCDLTFETEEQATAALAAAPVPVANPYARIKELEEARDRLGTMLKQEVDSREAMFDKLDVIGVAMMVLAKEVTESRKALIGRIVDESNKGRNSSSTIHKEYGDALRDTNANPTAQAAIEKARAE